MTGKQLSFSFIMPDCTGRYIRLFVHAYNIIRQKTLHLDLLAKLHTKNEIFVHFPLVIIQPFTFPMMCLNYITRFYGTVLMACNVS